MSQHIDLDVKSDRELLLLTTQGLNQLTDNDIPEIKQRLENIEKTCRNRPVECINNSRKGENTVKAAQNIGVGGGLCGITVIVYELFRMFGVIKW